MSVERAPRIATWLLQQCVAAGGDDSLVGDVQEEFRRRRSRKWYWKQTVVAVAMAAGQDARKHRWSLVRAVLTGFTTFAVLAWLLTAFVFAPAVSALPPIDTEVHPWLPRPRELALTALMATATFFSGWVVAYTSHAHRIGAIAAYFLSFSCYGAFLVVIMPMRMPDRSYLFNLFAWIVVVALYSASVLMGWSYAVTRTRRAAA